MEPSLLNPSCHTGTALCLNPGSFLVLTLALVWCVTCLNCRNHTSKFLSPPFFGAGAERLFELDQMLFGQLL